VESKSGVFGMMQATKSRSGWTSRAGLVLGPSVFLLVLMGFDLEPGHPEVTRTAAVALLMAVWWMTEAIPLAATALIPVVLFPVLGIMDGKTVAPIYFNHIIFLFIGGFLVALAMQRWDLHRRIALRILLLFGIQPARILLGFMVATAFLSMWISNTATTMMMVPIVLAVVLRLEETSGIEKVQKFGTSLFLGVAYGASIGGIATLVGTPPNLSLARILSIQFPQSPEISFASWFAFAFPISVLFLMIAWWVLRLSFQVKKEGIDLNLHAIREQYDVLGPISYQEGVVLLNFVLLALLWLFRSNITIGALIIPGWSSWLENGSLINDGTIAIAMALLLFLIPARHPSASRLMDWRAAKALPWHIVLLFGGGFALASGFKDSGLSQWFGIQLQGLGSLHPLGLVASLCLMITFLTELTSNTATAEMLLPILGSLGIAVKQNPILFMIPGTLSCSFAFMLPVATPPNAIVFGTDRVKISDMVRAGIILNFVGLGLIVLAIYSLGPAVLDVGTTGLPGWAIME
jgi:sodium-dependent dicarboxylate transporter 2/3/5